MSQINVDITSIFEKIFGFTPKQFDASKLKNMNVDSGRQNSFGSSFYYGKDLVSGGYYFMPVWLYPPAKGGVIAKAIQLPHATVSITARKNIIETVMTNRDGTVKELISLDDYKISVKGVMISSDGSFPENQMQELVDLFTQHDVAVPMSSVLTDMFLGDYRYNSNKVIVVDLRFPYTIGVQNAKAYEMELVSDNIFELYVNS